MNTAFRPASDVPTAAVRRAAALAWRRLSRLERIALAAGPLVAAAQLVAFVQVCEASVVKGERFRAEQRWTVPAPVVAPR